MFYKGLLVKIMMSEGNYLSDKDVKRWKNQKYQKKTN